MNLIERAFRAGYTKLGTNQEATRFEEEMLLATFRKQNKVDIDLSRPNLTTFEESKYQRERDVMKYIADTINMIGGDSGAEIDSIENWLVRLRTNILNLTI